MRDKLCAMNPLGLLTAPQTAVPPSTPGAEPPALNAALPTGATALSTSSAQPGCAGQRPSIALAAAIGKGAVPAGKACAPAASPRAPATAPKKPEVWVFDTFGAGGLDIDGDGIGDVAHGEVVAAIIEGQTGVQPHKVQIEENARPVTMLRALDDLLARPDVSNLYLNLSISGNGDDDVPAKLAALARRGAHVYIAAGNADANPLAQSFKPNPNIHIVGASAGAVGSKGVSTALATVRVPQITEVFNGSVHAVKVRGGVDLTGDGKPDIASRQMTPTPFSAAGKRLVDVDRTAMVVARNDLNTMKPEVDDSVVSIKAIRARGLIDDKVLGDLHRTTGKSTAQLDALYVNLDELGLQQLSLGDVGGAMLYAVDAGGRLQPVPQKSVIDGVPATSFAAPNALARHVMAALRRAHP